MILYEYQVREVLKKWGIYSPPYVLISTPAESLYACEILEEFPVIIKPQIPLKNNLSFRALSSKEAYKKSERYLGNDIKQYIVNKILVEKEVNFKFSFNIEISAVPYKKVYGFKITAVSDNSKTLYFEFSGRMGFKTYLLNEYFSGLKFSENKKTVHYIKKLISLFIETDFLKLEINPLGITPDGNVYCIPAPAVFDENSLFRHQSLLTLRTVSFKDINRYKIALKGFDFIYMKSRIGIITNGLGLANTLINHLKHYGAAGATVIKIVDPTSVYEIRDAFNFLNSYPEINTVLFSIYSGISSSVDTARALLQAKDEIHYTMPIAARIVGDEEKEAYEMLKKEDIILAKDIVNLAKKGAKLSVDKISRLTNKVEI